MSWLGKTLTTGIFVRALLVVVGIGVCVPGSAIAAEAAPLRITEFSMQATEATTVTGPIVENGSGGPSCWPCHVVNVPYAQPFTQAGGHPWALTTAGVFASEVVGEKDGNERIVPTRDPKDIVVNLPAGLLGNPLAVPACPLTVLAHLGGGVRCPGSSQIGMFRLDRGGAEEYGPVVNVTPETGQSAEVGLEISRNGNKDETALLTARLVHTEKGYGFSVVTKSILPFGKLDEFELTVWGVPADPSHNAARGMSCFELGLEGEPHALLCEGGGESAGIAPVAFWSLGTDCGAGPETATVRADSWQEPGNVVDGEYSKQFTQATATMPGVTGCNLLRFEPELELKPSSLLADAPVGLDVTIGVPQAANPAVNATPHLRDAVVTLPEGMSINPSVVDGIQACNEAGPEGIDISGPESEEVGLDGELQLAPGHCPAASTVGTAEAVTPLLRTPVRGHVYLARPGCGNAALGQAPCTEQDALDGNLYKLYLELGGTGEDAEDGIQIKVPGRVEANPATGQLTTRFEGSPPGYEGNPQAPFSELKVHLNPGPRASIANPAQCGPALATADLTPWSEPSITPEGLFMAGTPDAVIGEKAPIEIAGCTNPTPFKPGFEAGTVTPQAGQFSSFTLDLTRQDREQYVKGIQIHTPPGLLAMLASVPLCPEVQANNPSAYGECSSSKIGTARVATGAGSHPFEIEGNVFLTGPHDGAPFGLSIVTHAVAGPFDLGLVVVRARIDIDQEDSTATITTDETGPYAVPQIIFGVPLRLKRITTDIDRPGFMFNPTSCASQRITATISGSQGAASSTSSPFAVGGCESLTFKPKFTASTGAHTSRAQGASLDVKLSYPAGSIGKAANIARVKVDLPKRLPSRLTTLQKACLAATFQADPAACPPGSVVGVVHAHTPLLPVGLSGPVYFVSHGGEAFPSLIVVLQGDGVRVDLTGTTFISKAGITSSTFKTIPDVPVSTFELYLPQGRNSALAANGNLCKAKLAMPTAFVAQNGAVLKQTTKIAVTGCATSKAKAKGKGARTSKRASQGRGVR